MEGIWMSYHCCSLGSMSDGKPSYRKAFIIFTLFLSLVLVQSASVHLLHGYMKWQYQQEITEVPLGGRKSSYIHVISPFKVERCINPFCPIDQAQSVAMASMLHAQANQKSKVLLATATLVADEDIVPPGFVKLPSLNRSTTQYQHLRHEKPLPFLQDIFDSVLSSDISFEFAIFTNADIILHENFYSIVEDQIKQGYDFFSINRITISQRGLNGSLITSSDLREIYNLHGEAHPGHDCFVIKKSILTELNVGTVFLGSSFVSNILLLHGMKLASRSRLFATYDLNATYHLGDERIWATSKFSPFQMQNGYNAFCRQNSWLSICDSDSSTEQETTKFLCWSLMKKMARWFNILEICEHTWAHDQPVPECTQKIVRVRTVSPEQMIGASGTTGWATVCDETTRKLITRSHHCRTDRTHPVCSKYYKSLYCSCLESSTSITISWE